MRNPVSQVCHDSSCTLSKDSGSGNTEQISFQLEGSDVGEVPQLWRNGLDPIILNIKNCQLWQLRQLVNLHSGDLEIISHQTERKFQVRLE